MKILLLILVSLTSFAQDEKIIEIKLLDDTEESFFLKSKIYKLKGTVAKVSSHKVSPYVAMDIKPFKKVDRPDVVWSIDLQGGSVSILSNYTKIPSATGTQIELDETTALNYRAYLSAMIKDKHQIRLLYSPLEYQSEEFTPTEDLFFDGIKFLSGVKTQTGYKFNSYRLSYIYHFDRIGQMRYRIGLTGKIRDAYTEVRQGNKERRFSDLGFVPLLHLGAIYYLNDKSHLDLDIDGSWAPQGYAIDARLSYNKKISKRVNLGIGAGYLGGGADVESVKTFTTAIYGFGRVVVNFN